MNPFSLDDLAAIISARGKSTAAASYTKSLLDGGPAALRQKIRRGGGRIRHRRGRRRPPRIVGEAADVLYHLLVALHLRGVPLSDVIGELERRTASPATEEKASRQSALR